MFNKPNPKQKFSELEQEILKYWKENKILEKSISQRPEDKTKTFYDGPITANGDPHIGHALTFSMKDIYPRYWTMKGFRVSRSLGWDCQGLPVEYEIEKKLGFKEKKDIEKFGVAEFNKLCRELVTVNRQKIVELEEKMGRLTNSEEEYATMDKDYIESIWWSLKELYNKGLLYEGFKVVPYSTRAGTTLSNAEVALGGYKPFIDPAVTVEFPLEEDPKTRVLAWTTTPWTLPTNFGLAVGEKVSYVKVKVNGIEKLYISAKDLVAKVFEGKDYEIIEELTADNLIGKKYIPLFDFFKDRENCFQIFKGSHVTTDSGAGVVHLAPYGEEDNEIFKEVGIQSIDVLDDQGDFTDLVPDYAGMNYRDANPKIIEDLIKNDSLFKQEQYEHEMPMCWRTNTPLIYKPITSWYVAMSTLRTQLVNNNDKVNWTPKHVKQGRFGNWLSEIKDWGISRSRYWGTPLPIWKSETNKTMIIGSFEELEKLSGKTLDDPHKPYVDEIIFEYAGETYKRIPDVLDVWYDSGAMPFARFHYPFENKDRFEKKFPADYISESIDQTRGWFYTLIAISTSLFGSEAYKSVVVTGTALDDKGVKLSKSKKNYSDPNDLVAEFGGDAIRANFFSSNIAQGEDTSITQKTLKLQTQEFILPLWNIYSYLITYANIHDWKPRPELAYNKRKNFTDSHPWDHIPFDNVANELDAWIILRLQNTIKKVTLSLDNYEIPKALKSIKDLMDDISKWFIRSSRDRFAEGTSNVLDILYYVFIETIKLLGPFTPFITDYAYRELVATALPDVPESIHLGDYPEADLKFIDQYSKLEEEMAIVRRICEMGHVIRTTKQLKVRQPLSLLEVQSRNEIVPALSSWMRTMIMNELNVKDVIDKANVNENKSVATEEDTNVKIKVGLNIEINEELKQEGLIRELTRSIQAERKNKGMQQGDKVKIVFDIKDSEMKAIVEQNVETIKNVVNAQDLDFQSISGEALEIKLDDKDIKIVVSL